MPEFLKQSIQTYQSFLPLPYRMIAISVPLVTLLWVTAFFYPPALEKIQISPPLSETEIARLLFLSYVIMWTVMWTLYFSSGTSVPMLKSQTLRRLLRETSVEWETHRWKDDPEFYASARIYYDDMSGRSLTSIAVMVTASLVVLAQVNVMAGSFKLAVGSSGSVDHWDRLVLFLAAVSGFLAFIGFVIALDLLDSIFIHYKSEALKRRLQHRFFRLMVNRRYPALVALLTASIFLSALHSPFVGCIVIGIFFAAGYPNWFPSFATGPKHLWIVLIFRGLAVVLTGLPITVWYVVS